MTPVTSTLSVRGVTCPSNPKADVLEALCYRVSMEEQRTTVPVLEASLWSQICLQVVLPASLQCAQVTTVALFSPCVLVTSATEAQWVCKWVDIHMSFFFFTCFFNYVLSFLYYCDESL